MSGDGLSELRAVLAQITDEIDAALTADEDADTTGLEDRANLVQDQIDAILDRLGTEIQAEIRARPRPVPPPSSDRLF